MQKGEEEKILRVFNFAFFRDWKKIAKIKTLKFKSLWNLSMWNLIPIEKIQNTEKFINM